MARKPNSSDRLRKTQIAAYLEPEQFERLQRLHEKTRVPMQVYLREGLDMVLERYKKELAK
jgi:hypothetical protein